MGVKIADLIVKVPTIELCEKIVEKAIQEGYEYDSKETPLQLWKKHKEKSVIVFTLKETQPVLLFGSLDSAKRQCLDATVITAEKYLQKY